MREYKGPARSCGALRSQSSRFSIAVPTLPFERAKNQVSSIIGREKEMDICTVLYVLYRREYNRSSITTSLRVNA